MKPRIEVCFALLWFLIFNFSVFAQSINVDAKKPAKTEIISYESQSSAVTIKPAAFENKKGLAVIFEGTDDLHYYADEKTAPGGFSLNITATSDNLEFSKPIFPAHEYFNDPALGKTAVYVGNFTIFIPISNFKSQDTVDAEITIGAIACTSKICLSPFEKKINVTGIDVSQSQSWQEIAIDQKIKSEMIPEAEFTIVFALGLALLAGLSLNIMPCVWPVLPIIVLRIVEQAKQSKGKSIMLGLAFCAGILLFFACLALLNIVLQVFYGTVLQWGDQFRNPAFVTAMILLLVALSLFMFGLFSITLPSSITSKSSSGKGFTGMIAMGFLAAILSTPCSFAILTAAFAWAQAQKLAIATIAIMTIGIGMSVPYIILTSVPGLLKKTPKPGRWMEIFKQSLGFLLLAIAVKLITALPAEKLSSALYFAVILAFSIWMWGSWVTFNTKTKNKIIIRVLAVLLVAAGAYSFLYSSGENIDWQSYDQSVIDRALDNGQVVLIKFTASWCMNCTVVDKTIYSNKQVADLIKEKNVLAIKGDTTTSDMPATAALKNIYNEPAIPVTVLHIPGKDDTIRWRSFGFEKKLIDTLKDIK